MKKIYFLALYALLFLGILQTVHSQIINTIAGNGVCNPPAFSPYTGDTALALDVKICEPQFVYADDTGNVYITDGWNSMIYKVTTDGILHSIAGTGVSGYSGDGGSATQAEIYIPYGIIQDSIGNIYFCDHEKYIRKINTSGIISTIAGNGRRSDSGDGGPATNAGINGCGGIAIDRNGNIYFADLDNHKVRMINTFGVISTIVGKDTAGFSGDGGPATAAKLFNPYGIAVDDTGNLYIADASENRIRKVNIYGIITTYAGTGVGGYNGDSILAITAEIYSPTGITVDKNGNVIFSDFSNRRVRMINTLGVISTITGDGISVYIGDGGPATAAEITASVGVYVNANGNIYFSDEYNNVIRWIKNTAAVHVINNENNAITIFPNPSDGNFFIDVVAQNIEKLSAVVYNELGQSVIEFDIGTKQSFPVNLDLQKGIYYLKFKSNKFSDYKIITIK